MADPAGSFNEKFLRLALTSDFVGSGSLTIFLYNRRKAFLKLRFAFQAFLMASSLADGSLDIKIKRTK